MSFFREQRRAFGRKIVCGGRFFCNRIRGDSILLENLILPDRILIIRPFFLGDILLCLPLAQAIKKRKPSIKISWLLREEWQDLIRDHSVVDEVIVFSQERLRLGFSEFFRVKRELKQRSFDLVLNLSWDRSSILWSWMSGAKIRLGIEEFGRPRLLTLLQTKTIQAPERSQDQRPMADFYYEPLKLLGFEQRIEIPQVFPTEREQSLIDQKLEIAFENFVEKNKSSSFLLLHPGGRLSYKRWPVEKFGQLIEKLPTKIELPIVLVCGPGEENWVAPLAYKLPEGKSLFLPAPSFGEFMALAKRATSFIGNDSGPMHLAAAAGCSVIALFGKDPIRWKPLGEGHQILGGKLGLNRITIDEVIQAVLNLKTGKSTYS